MKFYLLVITLKIAQVICHCYFHSDSALFVLASGGHAVEVCVANAVAR